MAAPNEHQNHDFNRVIDMAEVKTWPRPRVECFLNHRLGVKASLENKRIELGKKKQLCVSLGCALFGCVPGSLACISS